MAKYDYHNRLMELLDGDEELLSQVQGEIRESKISEKTYAKVFATLYFARLGAGECISYSKASSEWRCGKRHISDLKLVGMIANVGDVIRNAILDAWYSSLISALTDSKITQKLEEELDAMETLAHVTGILKTAEGLMTYTNTDGQFKWDDPDSEDDGPAEGGTNG